MSNTRRATESRTFRQERFASAPEFERGLMANLVAKRCALLDRREDRQLIWFLQFLSHQDVGIKKLAVHFVAKYGQQISCSSKFFLRGRIDEGKANQLEYEIKELTLDPAKPIQDGECIHFKPLISKLREFQTQWITERQPEVVTSIGEKICEALEYAIARRKLVIIDGMARTGKTHAAKAWCGINPGTARYVQCPASNDDISFFREVALSLGVSVNLNAKAQDLKMRIEDTLRDGNLALVIDEAHYLWPQQRYYRNSTPTRINWIMTQLVNKGVAVALVTTPQFFRSLSSLERVTCWTSDQFKGRIGRYVKLPDVLTRDELQEVAGALLPSGDVKSLRALALYAESSGKYLGALEAVADTALYLCESDCREKVEFKDVERAIRESVTPSDEALKAAFASAIETKRRRVSRVNAAPLQNGLEGTSTHLPGDRFPTRGEVPARQLTPEKMDVSAME